MPETKVRLSAAIRKGCEGTRQAFDILFPPDGGMDVIAAAMVGSGHPSTSFIHDFRKKYHAELRRSVKCPDCPVNGPVEDVLVHLNDAHKMSRELIADFLESRDL